MIRVVLLLLLGLSGCAIPGHVIAPKQLEQPRLPTCWDTVEKRRYRIADVPTTRCVTWWESQEGGDCYLYELDDPNCRLWKSWEDSP